MQGPYNIRSDWLTCVWLWHANPIVTYPNKHGEYCTVANMTSVTNVTLTKGISFSGLLPCGYFEKARNPLPFSEAAVSHMVFLKLFLRLPVVLSSSPLKILEGFCGGIHSNRMHVIRNVLICFIEEGLFCPYYRRRTNRIWNYIFSGGKIQW